MCTHDLTDMHAGVQPCTLSQGSGVTTIFVLIEEHRSRIGVLVDPEGCSKNEKAPSSKKLPIPIWVFQSAHLLK